MHAQCRTTLIAPAKINLALYVAGKRPDGYHEVVTVLHRLDLCDELELTLSDSSGICLECPSGRAPHGPDNLAYRAAELFLEKTKVRCGVRMVLHKRIPVAAGLGGGSSDAASVLLGLNRLTGEWLSREELARMGAALGSDVPFFVWEVTTARGTGRGDAIEPVDVPAGWYVVVNPGFGVSTAWVYAHLNLKLTRGENPFIKFLLNRDSFEIDEILRNDLEEVTGRRYPVIPEIKQALLKLGSRGSLMSGSGPSVFGYFTDETGAEHALERLGRETGFLCFLARSY